MEVKDAPAAYDAKARARIRARLRSFMEQHRIGVPTLKDRIERADKRGRELPLSTLQRFLRDSHRTMDMYVEMCAGFLAANDWLREPADFGEPLHAFLQGHKPDPLAGFSIGSLKGSYAAKRFAAKIDPVPELLQGGESHSTVRLRTKKDAAYLLVEEDEPDVRLPREDAGRQYTYDGVALLFGHDLYVFLRSCLTRRPRHYCLSVLPLAQRAGNEMVLTGEAFERPALPGRETCFGLQLIRRAEGTIN